MERQSSGGDVRMSINPARGAARGPWLECVWSVSFKGGTAGRAITDDLPLAAGPGATLTESNHKQVNSTSTFLIFFSPCLFLLVSFCLLRWNTALSRYRPPTSLFPLLKEGEITSVLSMPFQTTYSLIALVSRKKKRSDFLVFPAGVCLHVAPLKHNLSRLYCVNEGKSESDFYSTPEIGGWNFTLRLRKIINFIFR